MNKLPGSVKRPCSYYSDGSCYLALNNVDYKPAWGNNGFFMEFWIKPASIDFGFSVDFSTPPGEGSSIFWIKKDKDQSVLSINVDGQVSTVPNVITSINWYRIRINALSRIDIESGNILDLDVWVNDIVVSSNSGFYPAVFSHSAWNTLQIHPHNAYIAKMSLYGTNYSDLIHLVDLSQNGSPLSQDIHNTMMNNHLITRIDFSSLSMFNILCN